jgi:hypothetical protein
LASTVRARRVVLSSALALSLSMLAATTVVAAPDRGCPHSSSGFTSFAIDPTVGDGIDETNAWWVQTVAGLHAEGFTTLDEAAAAFGVADAEALYELVMAGLRGLDQNGDDLFCAKPFPPTRVGQPAYAFNAVDNHARAH